MNTFSEQDFKMILDILWSEYMTAQELMEDLEGIGLTVSGNVSDISGFHKLYRVRDTVASAIIDLAWGNGCDIRPVTKMSVLKDLDNHLASISKLCHNSTKFPETAYHSLITVITVGGKIKPRWEQAEKQDAAEGNSIGGAYWDKSKFGPFDDRTAFQLQEEGFRQYNATMSKDGEITIWAHNEEEAESVRDELTSEEIETYGHFDNAYVTGLYACE